MLKDSQDQIIATLEGYASWSDKFTYIISQSSLLVAMPKSFRNGDTLISGCTSRTYFRILHNRGVMYCDGWSNAIIPSGIITLFQQAINGCSVSDFKEVGVYFHQATGLDKMLTSSRQHALGTIIERVYNSISDN